MCGRMTLTRSGSEIAEFFALADAESELWAESMSILAELLPGADIGGRGALVAARLTAMVMGVCVAALG